MPRPDSGWPRDPYLGRTIGGKYRLDKKLGAGGFAQVFLARQIEGGIDLGEVVLKFLHQNLAQNESIRKRFINEARAARQIRSPHAVKMFDLGFDDDGVPYLVMEYLEGESLEQALNRTGKQPPERVVRIGLQVAGALDECHEKGIIHRDLKPDNLLLIAGRGEDFVKVLDFGIARVPDKDGTVTHTVMGTPRYMPPEQIMMEEMDGGVDIFALGVILFECLAGCPPIPASTPMAYMQLNLSEKPMSLCEICPELPYHLEILLELMMNKERGARPQSMSDVERRLQIIGRANGWIAGGSMEKPTGEAIKATSRLDGDGVVFDLDMETTLPDEALLEDPALAPTLTPAPPIDSVAQKSVLSAKALPRRRLWPMLLVLLLLGGGVGLMVAQPREGEQSPGPANESANGPEPAQVAAPAPPATQPAAAPITPDAGPHAALTRVALKPDAAPREPDLAASPPPKEKKAVSKKRRKPPRRSEKKRVTEGIGDEYGDRTGGL